MLFGIISNTRKGVCKMAIEAIAIAATQEVAAGAANIEAAQQLAEKVAMQTTENITVSQEDFSSKLTELSRMYQIDPATMIKQLSQTPGVFNALSQQALNEKVTQFLADNNTVKLK